MEHKMLIQVFIFMCFGTNVMGLGFNFAPGPWVPLPIQLFRRLGSSTTTVSPLLAPQECPTLASGCINPNDCREGTPLTCNPTPENRALTRCYWPETMGCIIIPGTRRCACANECASVIGCTVAMDCATPTGTCDPMAMMKTRCYSPIPASATCVRITGIPDCLCPNP